MRHIVAWCGLALLAFQAAAQPAIELEIDFSRTNGTWRSLHGINRGPLVAGGLFDVIEAQRELNLPFTRLHDSRWPNGDVVDIHNVFPDFDRDPESAASYDFARTDAYIAAIRKTGSQIVYRLGESIEHDTPKRFVHPPNDPAKWARICVGIIRHYNEGWANGFHHGIRYWEIWNEPENRPVMWTGTDDQFLELYGTAARAIKARFPDLKVGGPGFGYSGEIVRGEFRANGLITNFLSRCSSETLPLDFLSWHCYTDDPNELVVRARGIRQLLDLNGFQKTESHLNEWNYLPNRDWTPISKGKGTADSRRRTYTEMAGMPGAAFIVGSLIRFHDAPLDMANLFHGETGPFGLFDGNGVPAKNFYAIRAFRELLKTPVRIVTPTAADFIVGAGLSEARDSAAVLLSNLGQAQSRVRIDCNNLPWRGATQFSLRVVDTSHDLEEMSGAVTSDHSIDFTLRRPSIALIWLNRKSAP